jgi:peptidoglycan/LPS O-acetylase OafA/YrhL
MTAMPTTRRRPSLGDAALLDPPRGYRRLAWLGLVLNALAIPAVVLVILRDPTWRTANIAVGAGAVLPTAVVGLVACSALLRWRHWGQVLAIVALSMSLAVALPYGIVRLVMVEQGRLQLALLCPLLWAANAALLVYWCRPAIRQYLR